MLLTVAALITAGALLVPPQAASAPRPLVQLTQDLDAAIPRAQLSDAQKTQLQTDRGTLETARQAREQGQQVNRRQIANAVKDIRGVLESGAFSEDDKQKLSADIETLRKR